SFFFQAEDGIRDFHVTGVQTCALPIYEAVVSGGDILIGRTSPPRFREEYKEFEVKGPYRRDTSVGVRPSENGVVDTVIVTQSVEDRKSTRLNSSHVKISYAVFSLKINK